MKRWAAVFAGQGSQKVGMAKEIILNAPRGSKIAVEVAKARSVLSENYGFDINDVLFDNVSNLKYAGKGTASGQGAETAKADFVVAKEGVLAQRTEFTQPAMLLAQWVYYQSLKDELMKENRWVPPSVAAGHSLGEFSALCAVWDLFPLDIAVQLVHERGLAMNRHLDVRSNDESTHFRMYAVNPSRAGGDLTESDVILFVELISTLLAQTAGSADSTLELVNYNVRGEQLVVTGTLDGLAILGKAVDPQFRANVTIADAGEGEDTPSAPLLSRDNGDWHAHVVSAALESVAMDVSDNVSTDPNRKIERPRAFNFLRNSKVHRPLLPQTISLDDHTLPMKWLEVLSNVGIGRSGLKKKSWYMPVPNVSVPFHSSHLRRAMDDFYPVVKDALPSSEEIEKKLFFSEGVDSGVSTKGTKWVTNLTGTMFDSGRLPLFREEALDAYESLNIGEQQHVGRYDPVCFLMLQEAFRGGKEVGNNNNSNAKDLLAAVLTAQLSHGVQWADSMDTIMKECNTTTTTNSNGATVVELSPGPTLSEMFKKQKFEGFTSPPKDILVFPRDSGEKLKVSFPSHQ